jgi:hypothetical protein
LLLSFLLSCYHGVRIVSRRSGGYRDEVIEFQRDRGEFRIGPRQGLRRRMWTTLTVFRTSDCISRHHGDRFWSLWDSLECRRGQSVFLIHTISSADIYLHHRIMIVSISPTAYSCCDSSALSNSKQLSYSRVSIKILLLLCVLSSEMKHLGPQFAIS